MALKLKKAALLDAYRELDEVAGVEPAIPEKLSAAKFAKELWKTVYGDPDGETDDDKAGVAETGDKFSDETVEVFEALQKEWGGELTVTEPVTKKGKGKKEPKAKKEKAEAPKKGKGKKEAPAKEEPKAKKGKGKKEKEVDLGAELKAAKKLVDLKVVLENSKFDDYRPELETISNVMVLRKQMQNCIDGKPVDVPKPKTKKADEPAKGKKGKGKKEEAPVETKKGKGKKGKGKKEEPLLTEVIAKVTDRDELVKIVKNNDELFEGFKAKKKMDVKKLRKAMITHIEPVVSKPKEKKKGNSRSEFGHLVSATSGKIDLAIQDGQKVVLKELAEELGVTTGRILGHFSALKAKGIKVVEKKGKYFLD